MFPLSKFMSLIFWPEDVHGSDQFGVKGLELLALARAGALVPAWFLLPAEAFYMSLIDEEYEFLLHHADATSPPEINFSFQLDYDLNIEINQALKKLCPQGERVAVRYSSGLEDGRLPPRGSESHLFVAIEDVARAVRAVWRSHFSKSSMKARVDAGFPAVPKPPAIIIQRMLNPECSGFCYTANPSTGARNEAVVHAIPGLLTMLTARDAPRDIFFVSAQGKISGRKIAEKRVKHVCHHDSLYGIEKVELPVEDIEKPCVHDSQAIEIARQAKKIALGLGAPQRIDWAIENGVLHVLSARQIEELRGMPDPDAPESIWDFAPLASILPGIATPLAGSLCRRLMIDSWCEALRSLGVKDNALVYARASLEQSVGWIDGRLCVNRLALAQAIARAKFSKAVLTDVAAFFGCSVEQVRAAAASDKLSKVSPIEAITILSKNSFVRKFGKSSRSQAGGFLNQAAYFAKLLNDHIELQPPDQVLARLQEHRKLAVQALTNYARAIMLVVQRWMHLRKLTLSRCGDNDGALARGLLVPAKPLPLEELLSKLAKLATAVAQSQQLCEALRAGRFLEADSILRSSKVFAEDYAALLAAFQDASTWVEADQFEDSLRARAWLASVLACGASVELKLDVPGSESLSERLRKSAQDKLDMLLKGDPASGKQVRAAARRLHRSLQDIAEMRLGFCRILNAYGKAFFRLGQCLLEAGVIAKAADVRWLTEDEVIAYLDARLPESDLTPIIQRRQSTWDKDKLQEPPAMLFTARGCLHLSKQIPRRSLGRLRQGTSKATGIGCGIGTIRARVRVIESPQSLSLRSGEILALPVSDIRFRFYLQAISGLIIEHGSVADELVVLALRMGKPVVLGPHGVCLWLTDGETIEVQAGSGSIRKTGSAVGGL